MGTLGAIEVHSGAAVCAWNEPEKSEPRTWRTFGISTIEHANLQEHRTKLLTVRAKYSVHF